MKRSIENVTKSDDTSQPAMMRNQQPRINTLRSSSDTPEHLESASNTKNSLATSFAQQESVLTAEQIESLKGFDKEGVGIVLDKIALDVCKGHPGALNAISGVLGSFDKEELKAIFQASPGTLNNIAAAAYKGVPDALNAISRQLANFTKEELEGIFQRSPDTLSHIAFAATVGYQDALSAISRQLANFTKEELEGIFQRSPDTLAYIAEACSPDALNAISQELAKFSQRELNEIFQEAEHTLAFIADAACIGHPDALNAISQALAKFDKDELTRILQGSEDTLPVIAHAACAGHPDALNALLTPLDGVMGTGSHGGDEYLTCLNGFMQSHLTSLKTKSRFLGLERAFCNLDETTFSRITNGVALEIISQLEKSTAWYKEFTVMFNNNGSDQSDMYGLELQLQENLSARVRRFINDNVLQRDMDQTSRESRIDFVKNLCDYLNMMGHHHIVLDLSNICRTYQSGLDGYYGSAYADSVLDEFSGSLVQQSETSFFAVRQESDSERDKRYKKAYRLLKSFNENLGLWIQFKRGRDPLSAQSTVVEHFKLFLRSYLNVLGDDGIDDDLDYEQVNEALTENNWVSFKSIIKDFMIETAVNAADSSFVTSSFRS